jgi:hypothetical protein
VLAVAVMRLAARRSAAGNRAIWMWNTFGALDLFTAIALGVISANGASSQLIHAGAGSAAVQVPFYLITHGIIFSQL